MAFHRGKTVTMAYLTMKDLELKLPPSQFTRVHKSYIVALNRIMAFENGSLALKDRTSIIPLGTNYKDAFMEKMKGKLFI